MIGTRFSARSLLLVLPLLALPATGFAATMYVGDWTNPIINHGEVDFRDPRRDKQRGRIWRIAPATR